MSDAVKKLDQAEMQALAQKLCEEYGAEAVELRFEMPVENKPETFDEFVFRYGVDPVGDDAGDEAQGDAGPGQEAA
jgi:hypothetical protein